MTWQEIGDRVFTRRYRFYNQQIGVILGGRDVLIVDTRSTPAQAREIVADVRGLTRDPVSVIVDTHWHYDHSFGNSVFRPAAAWGHVRAAERLRIDGPAAIKRVAAEEPEIASDVLETVIDPPENTFESRATVELGDRLVELSYHGRAHTDGDIVVHVPDARVLFAGDLLEEGAPPYFGDGFPMDWPATVEHLVALASGAVVPGHGAVGDRRFVEEQLAAFRRLTELARAVNEGSLDLPAAVEERLFQGLATPEDAFERALGQLRGTIA